MTEEMNLPTLVHPDAEILLIGWGSTAGAIHESVCLLRNRKKDVGCMIFTDLWPFPWLWVQKWQTMI